MAHPPFLRRRLKLVRGASVDGPDSDKPVHWLADDARSAAADIGGGGGGGGRAGQLRRGPAAEPGDREQAAEPSDRQRSAGADGDAASAGPRRLRVAGCPGRHVGPSARRIQPWGASPGVDRRQSEEGFRRLAGTDKVRRMAVEKV